MDNDTYHIYIYGANLYATNKGCIFYVNNMKWKFFTALVKSNNSTLKESATFIATVTDLDGFLKEYPEYVL